MKYIVLLRGINVGGNNKVSMKELAAACTNAGFNNVKTYINSGNIILDSNATDSVAVAHAIEKIIENTFMLAVRVLAYDLPTYEAIVRAIPNEWKNDAEAKCDVLFLWPEINSKDAVTNIDTKNGVDSLIYVHGAIISYIKRSDATKSGILKIIGTDFYKKVTIRNCNTTRKLLTMARA